jgi:hypothetical protein
VVFEVGIIALLALLVVELVYASRKKRKEKTKLGPILV